MRRYVPSLIIHCRLEKSKLGSNHGQNNLPVGIRNMAFHIWYIPVYICDPKINHIPTLHKITHDSILCLWIPGKHIPTGVVLVLANAKAEI